jgi:CheY-like chemotaxis protein
MGAARILIVEDEFLIRMTLAEALTDEGFEVLEAGNGQEAMAALQDNPPLDLLLTDIQLPGGMNGRDIAVAARERNENIPVIFMTGRPDGTSPALTPGYDVVISKPYLPSDVCAVARRLTAQGQQPPRD